MPYSEKCIIVPFFCTGLMEKTFLEYSWTYWWIEQIFDENKDISWKAKSLITTWAEEWGELQCNTEMNQ